MMQKVVSSIPKNGHLRRNRRQFHLALIQLAIKPFALHQLLVAAAFGDTAVIKDNDFIRIANRTQAVGDDQRRAPLEHSFQGLLDQVLGLGIHRGSGLVQNQDARVGQNRAGQGETLLLPTA